MSRNLKDALAWGLLAAVSVVMVAAFALLLKDDGASFSDNSAFFGYLWVHPVYVGLVVLAVVLVSTGEPSRRARMVSAVAAGLLGLMLAMGLLTWISALASDNGDAIGFAGIPGAGKVVGTLIGLTFLFLTGLAGWFAVSVTKAHSASPAAHQPPAGWPGPYAGQHAAGQYGADPQAASQYTAAPYAAGQYAQQYAQYGYPYPAYGQYSGAPYQQPGQQAGQPGAPYYPQPAYGHPGYPPTAYWPAQQASPQQPPTERPPSAQAPQERPAPHEDQTST